MKIEQTERELIIRETPGCIWLFSLLFLVVGGLFVYGSLGNFTNGGAVPFWILPITFLMGSTGCVVGLWLIYNAPITKLVANRDKKLVTHTTYGIDGRTQTIYHFDEIEAFRLIEEKDDEGDNIWSLGMELSNGETIKISSLESRDELFKRNFVFHANEFIFKQASPTEMILDAADESETEMS